MRTMMKALRYFVLPFIVSFTNGQSSTASCAKVTLFSDSKTCNGTEKIIRYLPVASEPLVNCKPVDSMILGPSSIDIYCDLKGDFNEVVYTGSTECDVEETAMLNSIKFRHDKCVGASLEDGDTSYFYECLDGPCPNDGVAVIAGDVVDSIIRGTIQAVHSEVFAGGLSTTIGANNKKMILRAG